MSGIILFILMMLLLVMLIVMTYYLRTVEKELYAKQPDAKTDNDLDRISTSQSFVYTALVLVSIGSIVSVYLIVKGTLWEGHLMEWLNIVIRLMHITFGIAWIGASFYFIFLENALNRTDNVRDELAGNLWAVHGGGF